MNPDGSRGFTLDDPSGGDYAESVVGSVNPLFALFGRWREMRVLGVDVGEHGLGLGWFGDCPPTAFYMPNRQGKGPAAFGRLVDEARDVAGVVDWLVIEQMQIDSRTSESKARALLRLQLLAGFVARALCTSTGARLAMPTAGEWTAGIPKNVRISRIEKRLRDECGIADPRDPEKGCLIMPPRHSLTGGRSSDAFDGLCLAAWQYDRLTGRTICRPLSPHSE